MVDNEIAYLRWDEFRRMAPSILRREVSRLGEVITALPVDAPARNVLVRARHELRRFVESVEALSGGRLDEAAVDHLRAALLAVSAELPRLSPKWQPVLGYVAERLRYVHDRIPLIY